MTVELAAQNGWSNLILKCYANAFVKADARTEEDCRQTISYVKGYFRLKLYCKKLSNQKLTANTVKTFKTYHHIRTGSLLLRITRRIGRLSYLSSSLFPRGKLPNVMASLKSLNKLPNTRVFIAAENGWLEVLELVALFLFKTGTCDAKNS